jgi:outer membrane protein TolC
MKKTLLVCMIIFSVSTQSVAADLIDIYEEALESDNQFRAAYDTYMSRSEAIAQARAALYPQVTLGGQTGRFFNGYHATNFNETSYYGSNIWEVTASQAIFNYQAWGKVAQAKAYVKTAQATFNDAAQNLILRTAKAYFDILLAIDTVEFPKKDTTSNIALAMNFPIVQGGLVQSQTRQAQYDFKTSGENFDQTYIDVVANSRIAFNTINEGISKVKADRQTVISQRNSLDSTQAQFEIGTRTMVDVVNAQQRLFEAQQQLAQDQYNLIYSTLNLKYLAGTLNVNDILHVNSWLKTTRINGLAPVKKTTTK